MRFTTYFGIFSAMQAFLLVDAEGINCRGSALCDEKESSFGWSKIDDLMATMGKNLDENVMYGGDGRHLACAGGLCAFLQGTKNARQWAGKDLKWMLKALKDHGCKACGSVPVGELNDVDHEGMLTANIVYGAENQLDNECDDRGQTVQLLEGPDSKRWVDAVLWKMNRDQVSNTKAWANNVPISCVGAVDTGFAIRGSICAIPREAAGDMSGEQAQNLALKIRDNTSCGFGAKYAADGAKILSLRGYLAIELIQDSCPANSQTSH